MAFQDAIYVAAGLAHGVTIKTADGTLFLGEGGKKVVKLVRSGDAWKADGATELEMVPQAVLQSGELTTIVPLSDENVLVGLRSAVVELAWNGASFDEQWWRPAACVHMRRVNDGECSCLP